MIYIDRKDGDFLKEKISRPKYNMGQNSWFMAKLAWTTGEKKVVVLSLLAALTAVFRSLINLYVSPSILSVVERRASASELVATILGFVLALMFVSAASAYVNANTMYGRISVRSEIVARINQKAATTSYPNIQEEKFQKLLAKAYDSTCDNISATEAVWKTLTDLAANIIGFVFYLVLMSSVQPLLLLVILATTVASYLASSYLNGWEYRHREEEAAYVRQIGYLDRRSGDMTLAKDIRIFGLRSWMEALYAKSMAMYRAFHRKAQSVYLWAGITDLVLTFLRNAVAYAYLIGLVLRNEISVAEFLLFFSAVEGFTAWVSGILDGFHTLHKQSLDLSTVREFLEYPEPFAFEEGAHIKAEADRSYEIRLENVSFRYPGADKDTLSHIDLTLHPGEKLALVGLNGAGKTTLIKLLCGFLDPTEGRVLLDGKDIRTLNRRDYYTMFSAVFQTFSLLAGTIAANVAQDEVDIDLERVKECVEKAGLRKKMESLKDGYETYLNREVYEDALLLSGGETQRLMLARALYKDAPFILLDEPTAALDPIAESEMYQKYNEMTDGKSSVYISHRLASTRFCDRIILIADAGIAEEGTHEELLQQGGKYAELFEVQSKYYKEGADENEENESYSNQSSRISTDL
jgi:ATP-binding cassette subfamily B protein